MAHSFRKLRLAVGAIRILPHIALLPVLDRNKLIRADIEAWAVRQDLPVPRTHWRRLALFAEFMTFTPEFRNVFYLRGGAPAKLLSFLCPPMATLVIGTRNIGPGLFIQHGIGTFLSAESVGRDLHINQQVTVGYSNRTDRPTIGNNVRILAGAKVIGKVTVGDNVTIGANAVVLSDVPSDVTVFGVPAQIVWRARKSKTAPSARQEVLT